jgi:hypothetical protein
MPCPALRLLQHRPRPLVRTAPEIAIAALRNRTNDGAVSGGDLLLEICLRHQTEPIGDVATFGELLGDS